MERSTMPSVSEIQKNAVAKKRFLPGILANLYLRSTVLSILVTSVLVAMIALGSRGFHWFDAALIGYALSTIFATAAITYKYAFWIARPPTGRYWLRSWQLFLSYKNFRRYTLSIPGAMLELFKQSFILKRGFYRWLTHQCIFWGVLLSCAITFPLTFGWLRFTQTASGLYQVWVFGFSAVSMPVDSYLAFLLFHALDGSAIVLLIGLLLAMRRRFTDLALIALQRFRFDLMPLFLLLAITLTGLTLTADSAWLGGAYYWYISLTHEVFVALWLISLPFGKFFHIIERPATVGIELYWRTGQDTEKQHCARCTEEFAPVRFIQDLKKTLYSVGENYSLSRPLVLPVQEQAAEAQSALDKETSTLWWQDLCPRCKRVMRAQANLSALGRGGNRFL